MKTPNGRLRLPCSSAGRLSRVIVAMALVAGVTTPAWAAGIINHSEIVERAIRKIEAEGGHGYLAVLQNNRGAVYYGSMFPDWGYSKNAFDEYWRTIAEIAHDTPYYQNTGGGGWRVLKPEAGGLPIFRQTLLAHAAPRAPSGNDAALAFLFGFVSHQVSDGAFHFTPGDPPLAFQLEAELWHGIDPPVPHWSLEWNLDNLFELIGNIRLQCPLGPIFCVSWGYPPNTLEAIVEAYRVSSSPTSPPSIPDLQSGPGWQATTYQGEVTVPPPLPLSIWVLANWERWSRGGMNEMVDETIAAWDETWRVLRAYAPLTTEAMEPSDPDGNNDWYKQPVVLTLTGEDTYSGVTNYGEPFTTYYQFDGSPREEYEGTPLVVSAEGQTTISLSSVDAFENVETPRPVVLKVDRTPPLVSVQVPPLFTRAQPLTVQFTGHDPQPGSGLLSLTAMLNQQSVTSGQVIDPFWWTLGGYSLDVVAEDNAGWLTNRRHDIELVANLESLQATVSRLCQQGYITKPGICNALSVKLDAALAARNRGDVGAMAGALNAFQNAVSAQAGKAISEQAASLLLADSGYVLTH